jgi:hypothetical protein
MKEFFTKYFDFFITNSSWHSYMFVFFIILLIASSLLTFYQKKSKVKLNLHLPNRDNKDTREFLLSLQEKVNRQEIEIKNIIEFLIDIDQRLKRSVQSVEIKRFNPFSEGEDEGNSFALALIDENGDGLVLSTIYARSTTNVFGKPVQKFGSHLELTYEERELISRAKKKLNKIKS